MNDMFQRKLFDNKTHNDIYLIIYHERLLSYIL